MMFTRHIIAQILLLATICNAFPTLSRRNSCPWNGPASGSYPCTPLVSIQTVPGGTISVWSFNDVPAGGNFLHDVLTATNTAMAVYQNFLGGNALDIWVYIVGSMVDNTTNAFAETIFPLPGTCVVQLTTLDPDNPGSTLDDLTILQTVAHELYHCVQDSLGQQASTPAQHATSSWVRMNFFFIFSQSLGRSRRCSNLTLKFG
jgi:hypothetical protein